MIPGSLRLIQELVFEGEALRFEAVAVAELPEDVKGSSGKAGSTSI